MTISTYIFSYSYLLTFNHIPFRLFQINLINFILVILFQISSQKETIWLLRIEWKMKLKIFWNFSQILLIKIVYYNLTCILWQIHLFLFFRNQLDIQLIIYFLYIPRYYPSNKVLVHIIFTSLFPYNFLILNLPLLKYELFNIRKSNSKKANPTLKKENYPNF